MSLCQLDSGINFPQLDSRIKADNTNDTANGISIIFRATLNYVTKGKLLPPILVYKLLLDIDLFGLEVLAEQ